MKKAVVIIAGLILIAASIVIAQEQPPVQEPLQPSLQTQPSTSSQVGETFKSVNEWLNQQKLAVTQTPSNAFVNGYILVVAEGLPKPDAVSAGQKRLTAERAAEVLAFRKLAEFLDGVAVVGDSLVKDAALQYDLVRTAVSGFVKGAQVIHKEYNKEDETALVVMKVGMTGPGSFAEAVYSKILKPEVKKELIEPQQPAPQYKHKPVPLEEKFDGLIVDASEQNFRPALINRIFTQKGDVLYDPSKISQKVLVEQGCGEYTNSVDKAKAALEQRGVGSPLIVKASGTVSPSDLQISDDDAVKVFSANQKANFLSGAKVAFVLK